jgi:hypothetical protein
VIIAILLERWEQIAAPDRLSIYIDCAGQVVDVKIGDYRITPVRCDQVPDDVLPSFEDWQ